MVKINLIVHNEPDKFSELVNQYCKKAENEGYIIRDIKFFRQSFKFATCCYCLLNTKTLQLTYSRAGHPYPILIRPGNKPEQLEIRGSLLGIFEQAEYVQQTIQLQPGDKLLLYSDGAESFIGGFDDQGRFGFDEEFCNLKDSPITGMIDSLNSVLQNQTIEPTEVDDITVIGLEIRPNVSDQQTSAPIRKSEKKETPAFRRERI